MSERIRVHTSAGLASHSRLTEVEAYESRQAVADRRVRWLVADHLGTPRMTADLSGSLSGIRRHDYLPFGEEAGAGVGGRTAAQGYVADNVRQKFTSKERDTETRLDYFGERFYSSSMGRFTTVDPLGSSARLSDPQTMNRYTFVLNNPLRYVDPDGMKEKSAWDQLNENERGVLAPKLITVKDPTKLTSKELAAAGKVFNEQVTVAGNKQATAENIQTVQNFLDTVGAHGNSQAWQQIGKIDHVSRNSVGVTVNDKDQFLAGLGSLGFVVNDRLGETIARTHRNDSARQTVERSSDPPLHFANDNSSRPNAFIGHWDPTSAYFRTQTVPDGIMLGIPGSGRAIERAWAAKQHGKLDVTPAQVREYIKRTQPAPRQ